MEYVSKVWDYLASPHFKYLLEILYYISGIVLAAGLFIAIRQLQQQRELSKIRNRRDAFKIAAERCDYFGKEMIPLVNTLLKDFEANHVALLKKCKVKRTDKGLQIHTEKYNKADEDNLNKYSERIIYIHNALDGYALFFVTGIADDNVGFLTCGKAFVDIFEELFPLYVLLDALGDNTSSTQALYSRWREKITHSELLSQKESVESKLAKIESKDFTPYGG